MEKCHVALIATFVIGLCASCGGKAKQATKKKAGEACKTQEACEKGLTCHQSKCVASVAAGAACTPADLCQTGLVCHAKKCVAPKAAGAACTPADLCQKGLVCHGKKCVAPFGKGKACTPKDICQKGLFCRHGKCSAPGKAGASCETKQHCAPKLHCLLAACTQKSEAAKLAKAVPAALALWKRIDKVCQKPMKTYRRARRYMFKPMASHADIMRGGAIMRQVNRQLDKANRKARKLAKKDALYRNAASAAFVKFRLAELKRKKAKPRIIKPAHVNDLNLCAAGLNALIRAEIQAITSAKY